MSQLDRELEEALAATEGEGADGSVVAVREAATRRPSNKRSVGLVVLLLAMGVGMLALVLTSFKSSVVYSKGVDELLAEADRLEGRTVRVEGTLVKGTLERRDNPCEYRFLLERNGTRLGVEYPQCSVPDTFRDVPYSDVEVTAEGRLDAEGRFIASQIMAKCPSKYEGDEAPMGGPPHVMPAEANASPN